MQRITTYYWFLRTIFSTHSTSKGQRVTLSVAVLKTMGGCLCNYFSLILCLFETCLKEKPSALSCIQVRMILYSVNVFFQTRTQAGHCHDDVPSLGLLIQDTD